MKCCHLRYSQLGLHIINALLFILPIICLITLAFIFILSLPDSAVFSECCINGVYLDLAFWFKVLGSTSSIWVLTYTLKKASDTACVQALADIRAKLNSDEKKKIHFYLMDDDEKQAVLENLEMDSRYQGYEDSLKQAKEEDFRIKMSNVEVYDYLGTIELGAIMLSKGLISLEEFDNQFGYRVVNIMRNPDLRGHILDLNCNYTFLLEAICALKSRGLLKLD